MTIAFPEYRFDYIIAPAIREGGMQRDMDLIRRILMSVRDRTDLKPKPIEIDGVDPLVVSRHVEMLFDSGYLEGTPHQNYQTNYRSVFVRDMSMEGHDFLASITEPTVWEKIKGAFSEEQLANLPLAAIKQAGLTLTAEFVKRAIT